MHTKSPKPPTNSVTRAIFQMSSIEDNEYYYGNKYSGAANGIQQNF